MPREIVEPVAGPWMPKVGWASDRGVQVGIESDNGVSIPWLLFGTGDPDAQLDALRRLGDKVQTIYEATAGPGRPATTVRFPDERYEEMGRLLLNSLDVVAGVQYDGLWADLDRQGVNRLVRILRKARDSAFGADA